MLAIAYRNILIILNISETIFHIADSKSHEIAVLATSALNTIPEHVWSNKLLDSVAGFNDKLLTIASKIVDGSCRTVALPFALLAFISGSIGLVAIGSMLMLANTVK